MGHLEFYEGVDIIDLVITKQKLTSLKQVPLLVEFLRAANDETSADFVENWYLSLEYYKMSEWDVTTHG